MSNYTLPDTELSDLREAHAELREKRDADRVKAIILLGSGCSATDVAEALLIDRNTVRTYYRKYKKGGLDKLLETKGMLINKKAVSIPNIAIMLASSISFLLS